MDGVPEPAEVAFELPLLAFACAIPTTVVGADVDRRGDANAVSPTDDTPLAVPWVAPLVPCLAPFGPNMGVGAGVRVDPKKGVCCAGADAGAKNGDGAGVLGENMGEATDM